MTKPDNSVIVVDDEPDEVELVSKYLDIKGFDVVGKGYNGLDAVELYKKLHPTFSILDLVMPEYDGIYAVRNIKQINPNAKLAIITGKMIYLEPQVLEQLKGLPIFYKPYEIDDLVATLWKLK